MRKSVVSIVRGNDPKETVTEAIDLLGGIENLVSQGDRVLLKPNFSATLPPETGVATDPKILEVLAGLALRAGSREVVIAEGSGANDLVEMDGLGDVAWRTGARIVDINKLPEEDIVNVKIANSHVLREVSLPRILIESDVVINVPKMKTTMMTVSLGLKNLIGVLPGKGQFAEWSGRIPRHPFIPAGGKKIIHEIRTDKGKLDGLRKAVVDLNRVIESDLTVIDGIWAMEGAGPIHGRPVKMDLIIAGGDIVAVEAVGAAVMGFDPKRIELVKLAVEAGLGTADLNLIEVRGESIEEVRRGFEPASSKHWKYYLSPPDSS